MFLHVRAPVRTFGFCFIVFLILAANNKFPENYTIFAVCNHKLVCAFI